MTLFKLKKNNEIIIVLCLAGLGQRFIDRGYETPKYLLLGRDKKITILEIILKNFVLSGNKEFVLMLNRRHLKWKKNIIEIGDKLKITLLFDFIEDTQGQAETAYKATELIKNTNNVKKIYETPIAFHNGDTILINRDLGLIKQRIFKAYDGLIDTFESNSKNYSYVSVNSKSIVKQIVEKKVISNKATTGFYVFSNLNNYQSLFNKINKDKKELYISDVYNEAIKQDQKIFNLHFNNPFDTIVLGTPFEYEEWISNE